jgi:L-alanine-DL-glutamate epimerase-like enolase superfamily enzyme
MGWDTQYTIEMLRMLEEFDLTWMEEPVLPDNIDGYARIRAVSKIAVAGGEHEFTRWGFRTLIDRGAVDYLQPDVNRVGGVTEARKIWALAAAYNLPVVPHMHNFHNLHLIMAHMHSPMAEYLAGHGRDGDTLFSELFIGEPVPVDGHIILSDAPGFGVELNEALINELRVP